ncbi:exo-alpha-sialidase [Streptomyces iconiensis]|uniref:exo-alpha-sialidase n=1 Tax=Streptomyces iconiensis TaxID=1384038 RepID=A0ABT7AAQ0_9ACTN|nr:exo-alpha-sialidase [Streptomyces iconiensis]MDJ1138412.1 exo-alpha-sialidase [Streptomyces iconiensis]
MRVPPRTLGALTVAAVAGTALVPTAAQAGPAHLTARTGMRCSEGSLAGHSAGQLQLLLENRSATPTTFTVTGPGGDARHTRRVPAGGSAQLHWTRPSGSAYDLTVTAPGGFRDAERGTVGCGLGDGTPQLNTTRLFGTDTTFKGLLGAGGHRGAGGSGSAAGGKAKSVRIPSMAVTNDGTILAATDARVNGGSDLPANIQVGLRRSTDNGATWDAPRIVAHADRTDTGTGDSSLLVDRETGRVFLFYNFARPGTKFSHDGPGGGQHVMYRSSDDDGATWSEPVDLHQRIRKPGWKNQFASSGHGIQTSGGRLLQPLVHRDARGTHAANLLSDDHGRTWRVGSEAGSDVNESKAVQRGTGKIAQNMRHNAGGARYYATSPDGAAPFGAMTRSRLLPDPASNADEISYLRPGPGAPGLTKTALFSNTATPHGRKELTVRLSEDDGASWPGRAVIKSGQAGYSTLAVLRDGTVAALYEVGDTGGIHFARFTRAWLTG